MNDNKMQQMVDEFNKKHLFEKYRTLLYAIKGAEDAKLKTDIIGKQNLAGVNVEVVFDDIAVISYLDSFEPKETVYAPYMRYKGKFVSTNTAYGSLEMAILGAIGCKHGDNNFGYYAAKLLA